MTSENSNNNNFPTLDEAKVKVRDMYKTANRRAYGIVRICDAVDSPNGALRQGLATMIGFTAAFRMMDAYLNEGEFKDPSDNCTFAKLMGMKMDKAESTVRDDIFDRFGTDDTFLNELGDDISRILKEVGTDEDLVKRELKHKGMEFDDGKVVLTIAKLLKKQNDGDAQKAFKIFDKNFQQSVKDTKDEFEGDGDSALAYGAMYARSFLQGLVKEYEKASKKEGKKLYAPEFGANVEDGESDEDETEQALKDMRENGMGDLADNLEKMIKEGKVGKIVRGKNLHQNSDNN